jgi:hypothetical protein
VEKFSGPLRFRLRQVLLYNLTQGLHEKSNLAQHMYEESHIICWNEARVLHIEPTPYTGNKGIRPYVSGRSSDQSAQLGHLPSGLPLSQQKSKHCNSVQCRLSGKIIVFVLVPCGEFVSLVVTCFLIVLWCKAPSIPVEFLIFEGFVLALTDGLCCAWLVCPIWCWYRCPKIGTSSIDWAQLKTETKSSLQNVVFLNKNRTMDNVRKHNICINVPLSNF